MTRQELQAMYERRRYDFAFDNAMRYEWPRINAQLEAAKKMAKALAQTQWGFMHRRCPVCTGWNMSPLGETDMVHTPDCPVARALAAWEAAQ